MTFLQTPIARTRSAAIISPSGPGHLVFIPAILILLVILLTGSPSLGGGLGIPTGHAGLGFGNLEQFAGVRINFSERNIDQMTGVSFSIWSPKNNRNAHYDGLSCGLVGFEGRRIRGISLAGIGIGTDEVAGITIGGIGVGSEKVTGIAIGGIGVGTTELTGIGIGGIGVGGEDIRGLAFGGIGVGGEDLTGVMLGGIGVGGSSITGLAVAGAVGAERMKGACLSLAYLKGTSLVGVGTGSYTNLKHSKGLTIGIFNRTQVLEGIQIGLLNYAGNNPAGVRWVPGINAHF